MLKKSLLFDNNFWEVLALIARMDDDEDLEKVFHEIPVSEQSLNKIFEFIKHFNFEIKIKGPKHNKCIVIPKKEELTQFIFSFSDWLSLQYTFLKEEREAFEYFQNFVQNKVNEIKIRFPGYNLFNFPAGANHEDSFPDLVNLLGEDFIQRLETSILKGENISIELHDHYKTEICPRRMLFIEDQLSVVGEDVSENCLTYFSLNDVRSFMVMTGKSHEKIYTNIQVNDFISQIRKLSGNESRIILRILSSNEIEFNPPFHLMENPCLITNYEGQKIYAATVEVCDEFFNWYHEHSDSFEILEPKSLKSSYEDYLNRKVPSLKNSA
ncbi:MAG: hypothetical protein ACO20H_07130 [Bacteriovoracaceae bacterium]